MESRRGRVGMLMSRCEVLEGLRGVAGQKAKLAGHRLLLCTSKKFANPFLLPNWPLHPTPTNPILR